MPRTPIYRGVSPIARRLTQYDGGKLRDYWAAMTPPEPPLPPADPFMALVRSTFPPRATPWLPQAGHFPIPHAGPCAGDCGRVGTFLLEGGGDDAWYCHNCLVASGRMPRRAPQPPPMSEGEIARRRADRAREEAPRRWRGDIAAFARDEPHFLKVWHEGDDDDDAGWKMVGKLDLVNVEMIRAYHDDYWRAEPTGDWRALADEPPTLVFYHAHAVSQRHRVTDCPAPLDTVVEDFLRRAGVEWAFAYERGDGYDGDMGTLRYTPLYRLKVTPEVEYDGRWRKYLPEDRWERIPEVREFRRKDGGCLLHVGEEREVILDSPYIPEKQALKLRRAKA